MGKVRLVCQCCGLVHKERFGLLVEDDSWECNLCGEVHVYG